MIKKHFTVIQRWTCILSTKIQTFLTNTVFFLPSSSAILPSYRRVLKEFLKITGGRRPPLRLVELRHVNLFACQIVIEMLPESSFNSLQQDGLLDSATHKGEYLIVTADDFGYDNERDEGIIKAFTDGIVTRASLIINGYSARRSAIKLSQEHGLALGLHLNLTEGKPVCENDISSLTSEGSCFFRGKFGFREALSRGDIDMCHVK